MVWQRIAQYVYTAVILVLRAPLELGRDVVERLRRFAITNGGEVSVEVDDSAGGEAVDTRPVGALDIQIAMADDEDRDEDALQEQAESGEYRPDDVPKARIADVGHQHDGQVQGIEDDVPEARRTEGGQTANVELGASDDSDFQTQAVDSGRPSSYRTDVANYGRKGPSEPQERLECRCTYSVSSAGKQSSVYDGVIFVNSFITRRNEWKTWSDARVSDMSPQAVVIYSDENLQENMTLDIPLQIKHTTTEPVISSLFASESCEHLGIGGLLDKFNELLGTSYSVDTPGLRQVLAQCIERGHDFGTAFGRLRTFWVNSIVEERSDPSIWKRVLRSDLADLVQLLEDREREDKEDRLRAVNREKNLITNPHIRPRRVWDLFSNRVVPTFAVHESCLLDKDNHSMIWPISHSWMEEKRRHYVDTPVNRHQWLVPLPNDTTLDRIRIELLNLGAEYAWLDVLCLRQEDSRKPENKPVEDIRRGEWELDVPTIGGIYRSNRNVVTYLSGLGRPFETEDTTSERHWLNRAWTLQEGSVSTLIGGLTAHSSFQSEMARLGSLPMLAYGLANSFYDDLYAALIAGQNIWSHLFPTLNAMLTRSATFEIDRIAGLTYTLLAANSPTLPIYSRAEDDSATHENAWNLLVTNMSTEHRTELVFLYPVPGDGMVTWKPSWSQLAAREISLAPMSDMLDDMFFSTHNTVEEDGSLKLKDVLLVRNCTIWSLAQPDVDRYCRRGKLTVNIGSSVESKDPFTMEAHHQQLIWEGQNHVLVGFLNTTDMRSWGTYHKCWIVGIETKTGIIQKVTVLRMDSKKDRDRLEKLNLATLTTVTLT